MDNREHSTSLIEMVQNDRALMTDLYQLTMAAGYEQAEKANKQATFDLFIRKVPQERSCLMVAGIGEALEFLSEFHFTKEQVAYLRALPQLSKQPASFFKDLESLKFEGEVWAMKEGTLAFDSESIMIIRAQMIQAQLVETYLENVVGSQTMFASKALRIMNIVYPDVAVEFGTRRSQHPEAAVRCARASYIAGFAGTSNVEAGFRYGVPLVGTMAHSFVMDFDSEFEAFMAYAKAFPEDATLLVDTYNTEVGVRNAILVGKEMEKRGKRLKGVRIDSGDLAQSSRLARKLLDEAGFDYVKIVLSSDLDETKIAQLKKAGANCNTWAVGTALATSADRPNLPIVYKLAERETSPGRMEPCIKTAENKVTLPGLKQIYRQVDPVLKTAVRDVICLAEEKKKDIKFAVTLPGQGRVEMKLKDAIPLLEKMMEKGRLVHDLPSLKEIRDYANEQRNLLPDTMKKLDLQPDARYETDLSERLRNLRDKLASNINERVAAQMIAAQVVTVPMNANKNMVSK